MSQRAADMDDGELEELERTLKAIVTKHSPVCNCNTCHRYVEVGTELRERQQIEDELDAMQANELKWI